MKKPDIETIFSALDNYATPPPPDLWNGIAAQLDEPKRKKRAIFWWPVAASLVLGLSLGSMFLFSEKDSPNKQINNNDKNNVVIEETKHTNNQLQDSTLLNSSTNAISETNNNNQSVQTQSKSHNQKVTLVAQNSKTETQNVQEPTQNSIADLNFNTESKNKTATESNKNNQQQVVSNDSVTNSKIAKELHQLENALAKTEEPTTSSKKADKSSVTEKWSIGIYAGIATSENYSNKKVLGADVVSKQSTGYGIKTNYKLNKKWGVSAGIKVNELGQSLANVSYYNKQSTLPMGVSNNNIFRVNENVAYLSTNQNYVFATDNSKNTKASNDVQNSPNVGNTNANSTENATATIDQNLQYIEIPLEISYAVFDSKKTNISFSTGGFMGKLISNEVTLDGTSIGENLNVNGFIYGSKLSSTVQYEVLKKTHLFVEPAMNYYINPIKNNSFNQFQWGLNFGVNVNF